jgi:predicted ATP-grasp superfamily ATP-dependent carboligase
MPDREALEPSAELIVIGASVRALAASARAAGWSVRAADLFRDVDLRESAAVATRIPAPYPASLEAVVAAWPVAAWCYTGALENHPDLVDRIAARHPLAGNDGTLLRAVRDPDVLAALVRAAGLDFPETRDSPVGVPVDGTWLVKPRAGAGGRGIARWTGHPLPRRTGWIWQRHVAGEPWSAAFVFAPAGWRLLGGARQLVGEPWCGARPFTWCGAVDVPPEHLPVGVRRQLDQLARALAALGLVGLAGVDLVLDGDSRVHVLEVNPRFTASMELCERARGESLAGLHLAACGLPAPGHPSPPSAPAPPNGATWAKAVLFATERLTVDGRLLARLLELRAEWAVVDRGWPGLADIPAVGTVVAAGSPAVTIFASGRDAAAAGDTLQRRAETVAALLTGRFLSPPSGAGPRTPPPGRTA